MTFRGDLKNEHKMKDRDKKKTLDDKEIIKVKPSKGEKNKKKRRKEMWKM